MQQRSRDRVEAILGAAAELLYGGELEELSTRDVAERSGVPVGTIYRYFENSDAIVAAFLDREMEKLDTAIAEAVLSLERVTLRSLIEVGTLAHLAHHQSHPQTIAVWFGGRRSAAVRQRVRAQDARLAQWLATAIAAAGFLRDEAPDWGVEAIVRLMDRVFEYALLEQPAQDQEEIVRLFIDMIASYCERWATEVGLQGLAAEEFVTALANPPVHFDPGSA
jgi:AcrR family transcriptional regulator